MEALLKISHIHMVKLNIDATNQNHQSALHLAIENEDRDMCTLLLQNEVISNVYIIYLVLNRLILVNINLKVFINKQKKVFLRLCTYIVHYSLKLIYRLSFISLSF